MRKEQWLPELRLLLQVLVELHRYLYQGFTGPVMETAKKAGARGGTILRARWTGAGEMTTVLQLQEEREVIAIVAPREKRAAIMEAVNAAHGARTEAGGEVLSLAVEHLARF